MIDYYKILGLQLFDITNLESQFKMKLDKYKNLPFYSKKIKKDIFELKEAYYVLTNKELLNIYNVKLERDNKYIKLQHLSRDDFRNNRNKLICSRNFSIKIQQKKDIGNEQKLKK